MDLQTGDILSTAEVSYVHGLEHLWDMLSEAVESGRLNKGALPDDYEAFVQQMVKLTRLESKAKEEYK